MQHAHTANMVIIQVHSNMYTPTQTCGWCCKPYVATGLLETLDKNLNLVFGISGDCHAVVTWLLGNGSHFCSQLFCFSSLEKPCLMAKLF